MKTNIIPKFLKGEVGAKDSVYNLGSLSNYYKTMVELKDFKNTTDNDSMRRDKWHGTYTYDDFLELVLNGDADVMEQIKTETRKCVEEFNKKYQEVIEKYKFDVIGEFFDVGLVLTGQPETWLTPEVGEEEIQQIELIIDGTYPDGTDLEVIIKSAAKVLGMVRILEDHGVEVKITQLLSVTRYTYKNLKQKFFMIADVKDYDEPINYNKCSALMSPTFLRRAGMKLLEFDARSNLKGSYGSKHTIKGVINLNKPSDVQDLEDRLFGGKKK